MAKTEAQSEREKKKDTFNQRHRRNAQNIAKSERESYREQKMRQIIRPGNRESLPEGWTKMKN